MHSLRHPFVLQLATGQLPKVRRGAVPVEARAAAHPPHPSSYPHQETFKAYIAQDAFFLRAFARSYAHALTKCTDLEGIQAFHGLIGAVCDELKMHAKYCE